MRWGNRFHLKDAVLEGGVPFERAYGTDAVSFVGGNPRFSELFRGSMKDFNKLIAVMMVENYKGFEALRSLVDVGGGDGYILNMIISKYPSIKGINFDLASVIEKSPSYRGQFADINGLSQVDTANSCKCLSNSRDSSQELRMLPEICFRVYQKEMPSS